MRYSDVAAFLTAGLTAKGYDPVPVLNPGPATDLALQKSSPGQMVFATLGGGLGLDSEQVFDRPFITVRAIGPQRDYEGAESLAYDIDSIMLAIGGNATLGTAKVLFVTRIGGSPALVQHDAAERYHFQCTYVAETQTGA